MPPKKGRTAAKKKKITEPRDEETEIIQEKTRTSSKKPEKSVEVPCAKSTRDGRSESRGKSRSW